MDDITIGDPQVSVAGDIKVIVDNGSAEGKYLNVVKWELISENMPLSTVPLNQFLLVKPHNQHCSEPFF